MKEILLSVGSALFGIGGFCLLASTSPQASPNPIMVVEIYRLASFYWIFGVTGLVGFIMFMSGVLINDH